MKKKEISFGDNSFDLISLVASLHVMIAHTYAYVIGGGIGGNLPFWRVISPGPAVVVLFSISGYLNMASYERSTSPEGYFMKKSLKIYPSLSAVILVPLFIYAVSGLVDFTAKELIFNLPKMILLGSDGNYVPDGASSNGSLWTVCIQLQFYIITPLISLIFKRVKSIKSALAVVAFFVCVNIFDEHILKVMPDIYRSTCFKYLYMYLIGCFCYSFKDTVVVWLLDNIKWIVMAYIVIQWVFGIGEHWPGNFINPLSGIIAAFAAIGIAYKTGKIRFSHDLSYGIFLWHMPVMVIMNRVFCIPYSNSSIYLIWWVSIAVSFMTNVMIEKPFEKIKASRIGTLYNAK